VHIRWLRRKIELDASQPRLIQTIRGTGYRFGD
jgi:DNA-binding response OmpR family regulator